MRGRIHLVLLPCVVTAFATPAGADEYRGTVAQQMACTPDVFRLCSSDIPDVDRIVQCLRRNMQQLSTACHAVFDANASMPPADRPQAPAPPARGPKGHVTPSPSARPPAAPPPSNEED